MIYPVRVHARLLFGCWSELAALSCLALLLALAFPPPSVAGGLFLVVCSVFVFCPGFCWSVSRGGSFLAPGRARAGLSFASRFHFMLCSALIHRLWLPSRRVARPPCSGEPVAVLLVSSCACSARVVCVAPAAWRSLSSPSAPLRCSRPRVCPPAPAARAPRPLPRPRAEAPLVAPSCPGRARAAPAAACPPRAPRPPARRPRAPRPCPPPTRVISLTCRSDHILYAPSGSPPSVSTGARNLQVTLILASPPRLRPPAGPSFSLCASLLPFVGPGPGSPPPRRRASRFACLPPPPFPSSCGLGARPRARAARPPALCCVRSPVVPSAPPSAPASPPPPPPRRALYPHCQASSRLYSPARARRDTGQ